MLKREFRFKQEYFRVSGIYNIPAYVICAGNYNLKSYCCKQCGEIYVLDYENPARRNIPPDQLAKDQACESCGSNLGESLVKYPENIFTQGSIHSNENNIDYLHSEETQVMSIYTI